MQRLLVLRELLIGCGNSRRKRHSFDSLEWDDLVTIDHDPNCGADLTHDLDVTPWPLADDTFDAAHAYQVLEHLGQQGDAGSFFATFGEIWRILKPGGHLYAMVPSAKSPWLWGDPSHKRVIQPESLVFLSQREYHEQVGNNAMSDFRWLWKGDFECVHCEDDGNDHTFVLKAHKPARSFV